MQPEPRILVVSADGVAELGLRQLLDLVQRKAALAELGAAQHHVGARSEEPFERGGVRHGQERTGARAGDYALTA